eukprot:7628347-Karenia_brevis.AAC.1
MVVVQVRARRCGKGKVLEVLVQEFLVVVRVPAQGGCDVGGGGGVRGGGGAAAALATAAAWRCFIWWWQCWC